jgi:hypothetical protein
MTENEKSTKVFWSGSFTKTSLKLCLNILAPFPVLFLSFTIFIFALSE